jgi:hypothetical protein
MTSLQIEGTVSERAASLDALAATDAELLIDGVLEIWIFDEGPFDGTTGTELALRSRVSGLGSRLQVAAAKIAVAAHGVGVIALHG